MPIYEYRCNDCQQLFEEWQKGFEEKDMVCPVCGGVSSRLISNSAFVLKGSGWYVTDYCNSRPEAGNGNGKPKTGEAADPSKKTSSTSDTSSSTAASSESQSS